MLHHVPQIAVTFGTTGHLLATLAVALLAITRAAAVQTPA